MCRGERRIGEEGGCLASGLGRFDELGVGVCVGRKGRRCWFANGCSLVPLLLSLVRTGVVWARGGVASVVEGLVGSSEQLEWAEGSGLVLDRSCGKVFVVESLV